MSLPRSTDGDSPLLGRITESNDHHIERAIALSRRHRGKRIGFLGVSFKSGTDDVRKSPALRITDALASEGYDIRVFDHTVSIALSSGRNLASYRSALGVVADLLVASPEELLAHPEFVVVAKKDRSFEPILGALNGRPVVDLVYMGEADKYHEKYVGLAW